MIQKETNMKYGRYAFFTKVVESSNLRSNKIYFFGLFVQLGKGWR